MIDFISIVTGAVIIVLLVAVLVKSWQFINTPYDLCCCCDDEDDWCCQEDDEE